jgi:hypothetical protein
MIQTGRKEAEAFLKEYPERAGGATAKRRLEKDGLLRYN